MTNAAIDLGGHHRFIRMLGKGAAGEVYLAENHSAGRTEAIKVLAPIANDRAFAARFEREARATYRLDHPNIVRVYEYASLPDGRPYMALEYVAGETVSDLLAREGRLDALRVVRLLTQLAEAVTHAHDRGVIHRDLKPQNLIVADNDVLKVLDFGLAKIIAPDHHEAVELTTAGDVFGSPTYMAPEQFLGKAPDPRTDIYAIGCIAYEVLVGGPPFSGTLIELMQGHMNGEVVPPSALSPSSGINADLDGIVLRCMAKAAEGRYPNGYALLQDLQQLAQHLASTGGVDARPTLQTAAVVDPQAVQEARVSAWTLANRLIEYQRATSSIVSSVQHLQALAQTSATHTSLRHAIEQLTRDRDAATPAERFDLDMQIATMKVRLDEITQNLDRDYRAAYGLLRDALDGATERRSVVKKFPDELSAYQRARHLL